MLALQKSGFVIAFVITGGRSWSFQTLKFEKLKPFRLNSCNRIK